MHANSPRIPTSFTSSPTPSYSPSHPTSPHPAILTRPSPSHTSNRPSPNSIDPILPSFHQASSFPPPHRTPFPYLIASFLLTLSHSTFFLKWLPSSPSSSSLFHSLFLISPPSYLLSNPVILPLPHLIFTLLTSSSLPYPSALPFFAL